MRHGQHTDRLFYTRQPSNNDPPLWRVDYFIKNEGVEISTDPDDHSASRSCVESIKMIDDISPKEGDSGSPSPLFLALPDNPI